MLPSELWELATDAERPLCQKPGMVVMAEILVEDINEVLKSGDWRFRPCRTCVEFDRFHLVPERLYKHDAYFSINKLYDVLRNALSALDEKVRDATQ